MKPLALTDSQLATVRSAATRLQPRARGIFLQLIASELSDADPVDDDAISAVIDLVFAADKMEKSHAQATT